ncbi:hypothetical protein [Hyalangium minutum]|uniref:Serine/threonine protein kinase PpkA n=1 Tax=Hyalangium minutum TaxID=394096 RepID=A0A085W427_9BACT|nr:hypothetical protein [Hyalangium minutum]KFE62440.1 Serine/threonine protein kinase PpkA [Hyalangium minutum]
MNREEAAEALQLLRRVVTQARDDTALQNWGVIWILHAFTNGGGFLGTHLLFQQGYRTPGPFILLWALVIPLNLVTIFWLQRKEAAGVRSFIERQVWSIWTTCMGGMVLVALANWMMGLDLLFMPSVGCILIAMSFSVMGALMGRAWYAAAVIYALAALGLARMPEVGFGVLGGMWFITQLTGGLLLHRARRKRLATGGVQARLV